MTDAPVAIRRALISVSDKTGLVERAARLVALGVELVSTGGTAEALARAGLAVRDVADLTGWPEMMDGRVKTLHPRVHGGLLYRRDLDRHCEEAAANDVAPIDLLFINLYPFEETVRSGAAFDACTENIDIGGPALIRGGAKNAAFVAVCCETADLDAVIAEMETHGAVSGALRRRLAARAYARTAAYDAAIAGWYAAQVEDATPERITVAGRLVQTLRYGENPHQTAAAYATQEARPGVLAARQLQGKELSYNNLNDTDAAFELVAEFDPSHAPAVAIIKHANPCGVALGVTPLEAYRSALACDPVSAFGGVVALNHPLDRETAEAICEIFTEVVIAPGADEAAAAVFARKKNLRLLIAGGLPDPAARGRSLRSIAGGLLVQDRDAGRISRADLRVVTKRIPTEAEIDDLIFAWRVAKHVKSNAIVFARNGVTAGIGPGQPSRLDSTRVAVRKALDAQQAAGRPEPLTRGAACASDAFFPFPDGLLAAVEAGAAAVIQPGGSVRDEDVIRAADEAGVAMVFTAMRHFRH